MPALVGLWNDIGALVPVGIAGSLYLSDTLYRDRNVHALWWLGNVALWGALGALLFKSASFSHAYTAYVHSAQLSPVARLRTALGTKVEQSHSAWIKRSLVMTALGTALSCKLAFRASDKISVANTKYRILADLGLFGSTLVYTMTHVTINPLFWLLIDSSLSEHMRKYFNVSSWRTILTCGAGSVVATIMAPYGISYVCEHPLRSSALASGLCALGYTGFRKRWGYGTQYVRPIYDCFVQQQDGSALSRDLLRAHNLIDNTLHMLPDEYIATTYIPASSWLSDPQADLPEVAEYRYPCWMMKQTQHALHSTIKDMIKPSTGRLPERDVFCARLESMIKPAVRHYLPPCVTLSWGAWELFHARVQDTEGIWYSYPLERVYAGVIAGVEQLLKQQVQRLNDNSARLEELERKIAHLPQGMITKALSEGLEKLGSLRDDSRRHHQTIKDEFEKRTRLCETNYKVLDSTYQLYLRSRENLSAEFMSAREVVQHDLSTAIYVLPKVSD
jgi:hypothetical protein